MTKTCQLKAVYSSAIDLVITRKYISLLLSHVTNDEIMLVQCLVFHQYAKENAGSDE